jgi:pathogenesis-related protein 1
MLRQPNYFSLTTAIAATLVSLPASQLSISANRSTPLPSVRQPNQSQQVAQALPQNSAVQILDAHNQWRKRYNVPALTWSSQLASYAQEWANKLLREGKFEHRKNSPYGENLAFASGQQLSPGRVVGMWGEEVKDYNYASNSCKPGKVCGHYTQIVWRNSKQVGCGVARGNGKEIWVCNYNPPGNYIGQKPY